MKYNKILPDRLMVGNSLSKSEVIRYKLQCKRAKRVAVRNIVLCNEDRLYKVKYNKILPDRLMVGHWFLVPVI